MNVRGLRVALATLVSALWAVFGVYHVAMAVVTGISLRGFAFGAVGLGAFALAIRFRGRARRLGDGTADATGLAFLALASLALVVLSFTLLG
ncbi:MULTISPECIES: hypothetical protein [Haloferax]|uniref:Uncharacterized protein n=2 Tax=Haloferax gibbonsii TaxID=35746 RepID=A0A0K1IPF4_HALGI|nr:MULTISPECIES: hypothetical protein [Haloferax]AKU06427.1 hypothetical protein ABY42_01210 [Haloferax gibbonsii]ELZ83892.1 hypothetical protein C454_06262 [Haloferax gibbonsii ATCC 33959]QOS10405.1 uncharacterized protein HfgLR_01255 [Haloferax gibbonsii]RDZ54255.1 hypothetical protein C5C07_01595 [Haloferax sp. Atlit-4N]REA06089.1 hypothetical protein DEQ92_07485 [Haloferax sp. Atlit-6N]